MCFAGQLGAGPGRQPRGSPVPPETRLSSLWGSFQMRRRWCPQGRSGRGSGGGPGPTALLRESSRCGSSSGLWQIQISGRFRDPSALSALGDQQPGFLFPFGPWLTLRAVPHSASRRVQHGCRAQLVPGRACWRSRKLFS